MIHSIVLLIRSLYFFNYSLNIYIYREREREREEIRLCLALRKGMKRNKFEEHARKIY